MATEATGTFHNLDWEESPLEEIGGSERITRARIRQRFSGQIGGEGVWDAVMYYRPDGTAVYAGYLRLSGSVGGRAGSVMLEARGSFDGAVARSTWAVVSGSGTGDLAGLRGEGSSMAPHGPDGEYRLSYGLD